MTLLKRIGELERSKSPDQRVTPRPNGGGRCAKHGCPDQQIEGSFLCSTHKREMLDRIRTEVMR